MNLEEAIRVLNGWNKAEEWTIKDPDYRHKDVYIERKEAIETVLQALEKLQEEKEELKIERDAYRTQVNSAFDNGFIHKDKIKEKIEETRSKMHKFESDNANRLYLEHFNNNYYNRQSKKYGVFNTQEVITHCRLQEYVIKMGALQELLKGE